MMDLGQNGKKINTKIIHLGSDPKIILDQLMIRFIKLPLIFDNYDAYLKKLKKTNLFFHIMEE